MSKIIQIFFPLTTYLHILQLEDYEINRFWKWIGGHFLLRNLPSKKPLVWTQKMKVILGLYLLFVTFITLTAFIFLGVKIALLLLLLFLIQPQFGLTLTVLALLPYEFFNRRLVFKKTKEKIASLPKLKVIGITGSFAKTSTKEILYEIVKTKYKVVRTPDSYNTLFGIAKVVNLELDKNYDFFICEMGAYKKGEIRELCDMVAPKFGILTGIAEQHLERFGSLQNIIDAKFELVDCLPSNGYVVLNGDNQHVVLNLRHVGGAYSLYGLTAKNPLFTAQNIKTSFSGTTFDLVFKGKSFHLKVPLLGSGSIVNILGAATLAFKLGVPIEKIMEGICQLSPTPNRMELMERNGWHIINDAYSSNPAGFAKAIEVCGEVEAAQKIIVTPGIIELGEREDQIHKNLGSLASKVFGIAVLVGRSKRTKAFEQAFSGKVIYVRSVFEAWDILKKVAKSGPLVLFENDLPENY